MDFQLLFDFDFDFGIKLLPSHALQPKAKKNKDAPKGVKSAYILFSMEKRAEVAEEHPGMKQPTVLKKVGQMWRKADESTKQASPGKTPPAPMCASLSEPIKLASLLGIKWKRGEILKCESGSALMQSYMDLAEQDKERYRREMDAYNAGKT